MTELGVIAPAFVEMAHSIVWASVATVGSDQRPRSRILHPVWVWEDNTLTGWIGTGPTPLKQAHLENTPYVSVNYWTPNHDTCLAECRATWGFDDETRTMVWEKLKNAPPPVGYDPAIIPPWKEGPLTPAFAALRLDPWRLRVFPGAALFGGAEVLSWPE